MNQTYELIANEAVSSLKERVHFYELKESESFLYKKEHSLVANIDIIGERECSLNLVGSIDLFLSLAKKIHGIEITEAVLNSFAGEFWNMILGPVIRSIKKHGISVDIMPSKATNNVLDLTDFQVISHYFSVIDNGEKIGELAFYCLYK